MPEVAALKGAPVSLFEEIQVFCYVLNKTEHTP